MSKDKMSDASASYDDWLKDNMVIAARSNDKDRQVDHQHEDLVEEDEQEGGVYPSDWRSWERERRHAFIIGRLLKVTRHDESITPHKDSHGYLPLGMAIEAMAISPAPTWEDVLEAIQRAREKGEAKGYQRFSLQSPSTGWLLKVAPPSSSPVSNTKGKGNSSEGAASRRILPPPPAPSSGYWDPLPTWSTADVRTPPTARTPRARTTKVR